MLVLFPSRLPGDAALQLTAELEARACSDAANSGTVLHVPLDHATAHWVSTLRACPRSTGYAVGCALPAATRPLILGIMQP